MLNYGRKSSFGITVPDAISTSVACVTCSSEPPGVMLKDGVVDFKQDNWKVKGDYPINGEWTGKTFFRGYGPYESDVNIESTEIREAITDYEFVGREKEGEGMISLFSPQSIKGVFVDDNQATIRILENGKSPTFPAHRQNAKG